MTKPFAASVQNAHEAFWSPSSSSNHKPSSVSDVSNSQDQGFIRSAPSDAEFASAPSTSESASAPSNMSEPNSDPLGAESHTCTDVVANAGAALEDTTDHTVERSEQGDSEEKDGALDGEHLDAVMADAAIATFSEKTAAGYQKTMADDAVGAFFKDMARYPLLKADEEVELARNVKFLNDVETWRDRYTEDNGRRPTETEIANAFELTPPQLRKQLHLGHTSKRTMIRSNLRLVVSIAKRYLNRGVPFLDLIQEGALGLNRATEKFDPDKGYKFSTYAYWWIRQGITRTIANDARTIRLPIHIVEKLNKLKKAQRDLRRQLNRNPTEAELAAVLDTNPQQLRSLQQVRRSALSLNHRVGKGEDTELLELLEDDNALTPEDQINDSMMRQDICTVLADVLTEREQEIITLRYGITTGEPRTLEEVGSMFNLSRERVRQIQTKAMRKLRRPHVASRLKSWLR